MPVYWKRAAKCCQLHIKKRGVMARIQIDFRNVPDRIGTPWLRPVVEVKLGGFSAPVTHTLLLDTGSPDTVVSWAAAQQAGVDLSTVEDAVIPDDFAIGSIPIRQAKFMKFYCYVMSGDYFVPLPNAPVLFVDPWEHLGIDGVLGTRALEAVRIEMSVSGGWVALTPETEIYAKALADS